MINFDKPRSAAAHSGAKPTQGQSGHRAKRAPLVFDEITLPDDGGRDGANTDTGRAINDVTGWALIAIIALAPVPLASARPIFWMIWAALCLSGLALYMVAMAIAEPRRQIMVGRVWPVVMPALLIPLAGVVQYGLAAAGLTMEFAGQIVPAGTLAPEATLMAVFRLFGTIALFVLAFEVATRAQRVNAMAWGVFAVVLGHAIWSIIALVMLNDFVFWGEKFAYQGASTGTFVNRNSFASFLGMGLVVGICMIMAKAHRPHVRHPNGRGWLSEKNVELVTLWSLAGIIFVALVLTQSRMGLFSAGVAALVAYVAMGLKYHDSPLVVFARATALVVVAIVIASGFGLALLERTIFTVSAAEVRTDLYLQIIGMIRAMPLLGTGLDSFPASYELVQAPPVSGDVTWDLGHSTYLTWWSEMGLLIGTLPILALLAATVMVLRIIRRRSTNYAVAVCGLATIILVALHSLVDFSFEIQANTMLFAVLLGMALGQLRRKAGAE